MLSFKYMKNIPEISPSQHVLDHAINHRKIIRLKNHPAHISTHTQNDGNNGVGSIIM